MIFEVRKKIHEAISYNRAQDITKKIKELSSARNPQAEIFKIRRERQFKDNIGFPLKDQKGIIQVSKGGIDQVVREHFQNVFLQNPKPKGELWQHYWNEVDELFSQIIMVTRKEEKRDRFIGPTL